VNVVWWDLSIFFAIGQQFGGLCPEISGILSAVQTEKKASQKVPLGKQTFGWLRPQGRQKQRKISEANCLSRSSYFLIHPLVPGIGNRDGSGNCRAIHPGEPGSQTRGKRDLRQKKGRGKIEAY
jgi:hypothetical protein